MSTTNSRIAKNTFVLYFRMILFTLVSLYTARIVLNTLGVEDYGIYNVVTGFVLAFGFLNNAMSASVQRFLAVAFEKESIENINRIFGISITIHLLLAFLMIIVAESIGLYFLEHKMVIPDNRMLAAKLIFHFSVISLFFNILNVPYRSLIIIHEDMSAFAMISLFEVFAKLAIAFLLPVLSYDKLIIYGGLLAMVSVILQLIYVVFCRLKYAESKYCKTWDGDLFKDMTAFAGWNLIGVFAGIAQNQGVNIVLNIFGGPVVNAARAISYQVGTAVNQLVANYQLAVTPPIMKTYAHDIQQAKNLVVSSSKLSFILLLFIVIPAYIYCPQILSIWLKNVPEYAISFTRLVLIDTLFASFSGPIHILFQATGKIRNYQIIISGILLLNLPLAYIILHYGYSYDSVFVLTIFLTIATLICRLIIISRYIDINLRIFTVKVFAPCFIIAFLATGITYVISLISSDTIFNLLFNMATSVVIIAILSWIIALTQDERGAICRFVGFKYKHENN